MKRFCRIASTLLLSALCACPVLSQTEIKKRQTELENIRDQIKEYEENPGAAKERACNPQLLDSYDKKATLVRRLITRLKTDEQLIQTRIEALRKGMVKLEGQLDFLKKHYASYVTSIYRTGRTRDIELLLSSSSINQLYIRNEYLQRFTEQRKRDAESISGKQKDVEDSQAQLHLQLSEEQRLLAEKGAEEERLDALATDRRNTLVRIRKDRKFVQHEIDRQMKAAKELEGMIAQLIEMDRLRQERESEKARRSNLPQPPAVTGGFENKKGKLRWPVDEGTVVAHFGNQRHPTLRTVTLNTGIDISVRAGSSVTSVADGEVATIWWLPSYGNLIIVNHHGGFRTVYTHLAEIRVAEGEKLKEGDMIGVSGEALDGPRLHFEIWKDREKQNPESWLAHP